jgi:hypothetical protein
VRCRNEHKILVRKLEGIDHLRDTDLGVNGTIRILKKYVRGMWTVSIWLKTKSSAETS